MKKRPVKEEDCIFYAFVILVLGLALRLAYLGTKSIYVDEAVTLYIITRPLARILPFMLEIREVHPPLYFYFIRIWSLGWKPFSALNHSYETYFRLSSVAFSAGGIWLTFLLGKRLFDCRTGLLSAFLLSISTFHVVYSQELRMYPMLLFLGLLSFHLFLLILERPSLPRAAGLVLANGAALLTHYFSIYFVAVEVLYGLFLLHKINTVMKRGLAPSQFRDGDEEIGGKAEEKPRRGPAMGLVEALLQKTVAAPGTLGRSLRTAALSVALSLAPLLWWIPYFIRQTGHQDFTLRVNPGPQTLFLLLSAMAYGQNLDAPKIWGFSSMLPASALPIALAIYGATRDRARGRVFTLLYFLVPLLGTLAVTFTRFHIFEYKYFYIITPALWILVAQGLLSLRTRYLKEVLLSVIIAVNGYSMANFHLLPFYQSQNWRGAAQAVARRAGSGQKVIVTPSMMSLGFSVYYPKAESVMPMDEPDSRLKALLDSGESFFLVSTVNHPYVRRAGLIPAVEKRMKRKDMLELKSHNPPDVIRIYYFVPTGGK